MTNTLAKQAFGELWADAIPDLVVEEANENEVVVVGVRHVTRIRDALP